MFGKGNPSSKGILRPWDRFQGNPSSLVWLDNLVSPSTREGREIGWKRCVALTLKKWMEMDPPRGGAGECISIQSKEKQLSQLTSISIYLVAEQGFHLFGWKRIFISIQKEGAKRALTVFENRRFWSFEYLVL